MWMPLLGSSPLCASRSEGFNLHDNCRKTAYTGLSTDRAVRARSRETRSRRAERNHLLAPISSRECLDGPPFDSTLDVRDLLRCHLFLVAPQPRLLVPLQRCGPLLEEVPAPNPEETLQPTRTGTFAEVRVLAVQ